MPWLFNTVVALNQLANALTGGKADESLSSRLGNARLRGGKKSRFICAFLEKVDSHDQVKDGGDHCTVAVARHKVRTEIAAERAK